MSENVFKDATSLPPLFRWCTKSTKDYADCESLTSFNEVAICNLFNERLEEIEMNVRNPESGKLVALFVRCNACKQVSRAVLDAR